MLFVGEVSTFFSASFVGLTSNRRFFFVVFWFFINHLFDGVDFVAIDPAFAGPYLDNRAVRRARSVFVGEIDFVEFKMVHHDEKCV